MVQLALISSSDVLRDALSLSLRARKFEVCAFPTATDCLQSSLWGHFACIVVDLSAGAGVGRSEAAYGEVVQQIRAYDRSVAIVVLMDALTKELRLKAQQQHVLVLQKPIDPTVLGQTLAHISGAAKGDR